jgi:MtN3 and saliva related transmembrane protein
MTLIDGVGFMAAIFTTIAFIPQAYRVYKTQQTHDLSLGMLTLFALGLFLWAIYGILVSSPPIILANLVTLSLTGYILFKKLTLS